MVTIQELLDDGAGIELTMLGGAVPSEDVVRVVIAETLEEVGEATGKVLVVVTPGALQGREPYEFDIAIRKGAAQGIAAVLLMGQEQTLPTAARIAERSGIAILTAPRGASIADTVLGIDRRLRSDLGDQVDRALQTIDRLRSRSEARALEVLLAEASSAMGVRIGLTDEVDGEPVIVNGETRYRLVADRITLAAQLSLPVVAAAAARWQERRDAEDQAPEQVRAEALTDLVLRESSAIALGAADRLRATGLIPEATHVGVVFSQVAKPALDASELVQVRTRRDRLRFLIAANLPDAKRWSVTVIGDDVLLVRSGTQPDLPTTMSVAVDISVVVERVREDLAEPVFVGVGSAQQGLSGLRVSATEARIAAADLAAHGKNWAIATVDSSGLSRILAEIAGSVTGRSAIAELLAPFDALGAEKARIMIDTLAAYLDTQGSLREAAQRLHLHPNAVGYRLRRIRELSSYDLGDPDLRFALQLACRIRRSLSAQVMT